MKKLQTLTQIYRSELKFLKARPRKNYSVLVDTAGMEVMIFYGKGGPGQKPGICLQTRSDTHVPIVYPESREWKIKFRIESQQGDFWDESEEPPTTHKHV